MSEQKRDGIDLDAIRAGLAKVLVDHRPEEDLRGEIKRCSCGLLFGIQHQANGYYEQHRLDLLAEHVAAAVAGRDAEAAQVEAERDDIFAELKVITAERDRNAVNLAEARAGLGAVAALADGWDEQGIAFFTGTRPSDLLRDVLAPVSGAVEEAGRGEDTTEVLARAIHPEGVRADGTPSLLLALLLAIEETIGDVIADTGDNTPTVLASNIATRLSAAIKDAQIAPVAGHEQEVRAGLASALGGHWPETDAQEFCACGVAIERFAAGFNAHLAEVILASSWLAAYATDAANANQEHAGAEWSALRTEVEQLQDALREAEQKAAEKAWGEGKNAGAADAAVIIGWGVRGADPEQTPELSTNPYLAARASGSSAPVQGDGE